MAGGNSTSPIQLEDVESYLARKGEGYLNVLKRLDDRIIKGRDSSGVPVYSTKYRVKKAESIFIKILRKNYAKSGHSAAKINADEIIEKATDIAGMRILTLFNQDLEIVFEYLLNTVFRGYSMTNCKVYNLDDSFVVRLRASPAWDHYINDEFNLEKNFDSKTIKKSGYRSIHFVVRSKLNDETYYAEVQLRTLLQDVWGELEHALAYKQGGVPNHVSDTFRWLTDDLENVGLMLSDMKRRRDQDHLLEQCMNTNSGPHAFMEYDPGIQPPNFSVAGPLKDAHDAYVKHCKSRNTGLADEKYHERARVLFKAVCSCKVGDFKFEDLGNDQIVYWIKMEDAFLNFCGGHLDTALVIYQKIMGDERFNKFYVPYFRAGEIFFLQRNHVRAFSLFNKAEMTVAFKGGDDEVNRYNKYLVKLKMALNYWVMGAEYLPLAHREILEADILAKELGERLTADDKLRLANNLCWYEIEVFRSKWDFDESDRKKSSDRLATARSHLDAAATAFSKMRNALDSEAVTGDTLNTAAWYYFTLYEVKLSENLESDAITALETAALHCKRMIRRTVAASLKTAVQTTQTQHIRLIQDAAERHGLDLTAIS